MMTILSSVRDKCAPELIRGFLSVSSQPPAGNQQYGILPLAARCSTVAT
jgi:hypothetical protein